MRKEKSTEAILVIATGFLLLFFLKQKEWMLYVSFGAGIIGIFFKPLARLIAKGWFKIGDLLGFVVSKVVLAVTFFILLAPIAFFYKLFNNDPLRLKNKYGSLWSERKHTYTANDLKNIW
ncbi:MAG: hypothetical protein JW798_00820 [Prolixibacteraceae bacterium]|nr:hypothetical protein [Prolixibacteraceae bacterium]